MFVLSPATLAALHSLVALLLALMEALAAPVEGARRPLMTRVATRAFSAYLKRLVAHLEEMEATIAAEPVPHPEPEPEQKPKPTRARRIRSRGTRLRRPAHPSLVATPARKHPPPGPPRTKIGRLSPAS